MNTVTDYFASVGFGGSDLDRIVGSFVQKMVEKGDHLVQEGRISHHLSFIETGVFHYYINNDGTERTTYVVGEGGFVASLVSFFKQVPARENIRAMTDGVVWQVHRDQLTNLRQTVPAFKDFYTGLLEWQIGCIDDSRLNLLALSAEERYQKLLTEEPHLLQQISLHHLASILGVTPRHLSRIRGSIR